MPLYRTTWEDGTVTVVLATNMNEALEKLEEIAESVLPDNVTLVNNFCATFESVNDPHEKDVEWDVTFDEDTEEMLVEAAGTVDLEDEED